MLRGSGQGTKFFDPPDNLTGYSQTGVDSSSPPATLQTSFRPPESGVKTLATIIAAESDSIVVGQIATMVRELEASKIKVREAEAHYETIRDAILSTMVEHGIEGSVNTVYGMVTHVQTPTWEYKDGEVTKQTKAVDAAKRTLDNLKKLLKAAQQIAQNNNKAKVVKVDHSLRYFEPK